MEQELFIIKEVNVSSLGEKEREDALREARLLASLNHPNIVRFRESKIDSAGALSIVMEYAERGPCRRAVLAVRLVLMVDAQGTWAASWTPAAAGPCPRARSWTGLCRSALA